MSAEFKTLEKEVVMKNWPLLILFTLICLPRYLQQALPVKNTQLLTVFPPWKN
jgi:hypothetical protein